MGQLPLADRADPAANAPAVAGMHEAQQAVCAAGLGSPLAHLAVTSGTVTDPATHVGMVRVGAGLVGIDPLGTVEMHGASRLTAPIVHTTAVAAGTPVGYAGTHVTDRATHLSVLPVGYADGVPRELSPQAGVEICGRRFPVVGRVSMDQIVIDTGAESRPQRRQHHAGNDGRVPGAENVRRSRTALRAAGRAPGRGCRRARPHEPGI